MVDAIEYFLRLYECKEETKDDMECMVVFTPDDLLQHNNDRINQYNLSNYMICKNSLLTQYIESIDYFFSNNFDEGVEQPDKYAIQLDCIQNHNPELYTSIEEMIMFSKKQLLSPDRYKPVDLDLEKLIKDGAFVYSKLLNPPTEEEREDERKREMERERIKAEKAEKKRVKKEERKNESKEEKKERKRAKKERKRAKEERKRVKEERKIAKEERNRSRKKRKERKEI